MAKKKETTLGRKLWVSFTLLFFLFIIASLIAAIYDDDTDLGGNVAHIRIVGPIMGDSSGGVFSDTVIGSTEIVKQLQRAADDDSIEAILIEINSPGGSAVASDEIGRAIKELDKPTVAWIREMGASGGYWVASATDHVVANRMSITGSIGVYASYLEFAEFLDDWNVTHRRLVSGERKDAGDPFQELTPAEEAFLQGKIDLIHDFFIEEVTTNRNMSRRDVRELADGGFMLGVEAYEAGLVDELGGKQEALDWIASETGIEPYPKVFEPDRGFWDELFGVKQQEPRLALTEDAPIPTLTG